MHPGFSTRLLRGVACSLTIVVAGLAGTASGATVPRDAGGRAAGLPGTETLQIGPITARDGFDLYIVEQGCGSPSASLALEYVKVAGLAQGEILMHTYRGIAADCSLQKSTLSARLSARFPGILDLDTSLGQARGARESAGAPGLCGPTLGRGNPATATGTLDVALHPAVFGRVSRSSAPAEIFAGIPACPNRDGAGAREFTADVGAFVLDGLAPGRGASELDIVDPAGDRPAYGITGTLGLWLAGGGAYALGRGGSAVMAGEPPFASGSLAFSALSACPGDSAQNGTLSGTLTVHDPLLGLISVVGPNASLAYTGLGAAQPGGCNGPGSQPVAPSLLNNCDPAAACSVSGGSAGVTFFDETDPGTQTITGESVNFGDGSAPAAIGNYGTTEHAYSAPGIYTVTLTVTDALGEVSTATTTVYINP